MKVKKGVEGEGLDRLGGGGRRPLPHKKWREESSTLRILMYGNAICKP